MKKILLTILFLVSPVYAFENYMLISNVPVKSVSVAESEILEAKTLYTIDNMKKIIVVTPKKEGKTSININLYNANKKIDVKISNKVTKFYNTDGFTLFEMDSPPSEVYIPSPPQKVEIFSPPTEVK